MKHLTILSPQVQTTLSTVSCIVGAYEVFTSANACQKQHGKKPLFKVEIAGTAKKAAFSDGLLLVQPHAHISSIKKTNLIIIPSTTHEFEKVAKKNIAITRWIEEQYNKGAEIASMCTGAFMLASTGLLDGKSCSTHWNSASKMRELFPAVNLETEKTITDENGICTNGGGYSFLNLLIYLVEKYYDRKTAIYCSKILQIEIDRETQSPFAIFVPQKTHGDDVVKKAQDYIEGNFYEKISVEDLSKKFAVGRRNFDRRFIKATGNTPVEYLQRVKIESAKKAFETTRKNINEVMYEVGYSDAKAFREVFRKITGVSPLVYKNKYNKEAVNEYKHSK